MTLIIRSRAFTICTYHIRTQRRSRSAPQTTHGTTRPYWQFFWEGFTCLPTGLPSYLEQVRFAP